MSSEPVVRRDSSPALSPAECLNAGREILRLEAVALWRLSDQLGESFHQAIDLICSASGSVIVTGMGKAGLVGQKIAATLASTGTRSHFVHPAEAFHGDLGRLHASDVVLMLTQSGETGEVTQLLPSLRNFNIPIIAVTAREQSTVGRAANCVLELGKMEEACSLGLAPSTSTTAMIAIGDALALVVSRLRGFQPEDFARFHPGGSLGRHLSSVDDHMRPVEQCRIAPELDTVRQVIANCTRPGRRTGAIMLVDENNRLTGIYTDSDLARLFERREETALDRPIHEIMGKNPTTVLRGSLLRDAVELLANKKISELPVVDKQGQPCGLLDVTDIVGLDVSPTDDRDGDAHVETLRIFNEEQIADEPR